MKRRQVDLHCTLCTKGLGQGHAIVVKVVVQEVVTVCGPAEIPAFGGGSFWLLCYYYYY